MTSIYTQRIRSCEMTTEDYRRALATAIREYETLGQQRQDIDKRLAEVMQTIGTLSRLCGLVPTVPLGLTDACRLVVRGAGVPVTPADVRQRLQSIGFDLSKYANDLAATHTILKRLNESGELRFVPHTYSPLGGKDRAKQAYIWNHGHHVVALGADIQAFMRDANLEREAMRAHDDPAPPQPSRRAAPPLLRRGTGSRLQAEDNRVGRRLRARSSRRISSAGPVDGAVRQRPE